MEEERLAVIIAVIDCLEQSYEALENNNNSKALEWIKTAKEGTDNLYNNLEHTNLIKQN